MKKAYLYNRVSKNQQSEGQGLQRQKRLAKEFLTQFPEYSIAESITDIGKSGFYGKNLDGGLGNFIANVKEGFIKPDSLLVIEAPDRLSRLPTRQARKLINQLLDLKINIAIVKYNLIVRHDEENDLSSDILLTVALNLAYRESLQKSERIKATMQIKRDSLTSGTKYTSIKPWWYDNQHHALVNRIFTLKAGGTGFEGIAKLLNSEGIVNPSSRKGKFWNKTGIKHLITQRKVLGEYQPHKVSMKDGKRINIPVGDIIPDYFPKVVSEELWKAANSTIRIAKGGNTGNFKNLLRGLLICPECGETLVLKSKDSKSKIYLTCNGRKVSKGCTRSNTSYIELEKSVIKALSHLSIPTIDNSEAIQVLEHGLQQLHDQQTNLVNAITTATDTSVIGLLTDKLNLSKPR